MKSISKLSLLAALATIVSSAAYADDPQLQNRIAMQRQEAERYQPTATIGVYADERAIGERYVTVRTEPGMTDASGRTLVPLHLGRGEVIYVPVQP
jgi:hypothetical protein